MTDKRAKRRPRRFLQFSLRTLLVFVLLVSIGMSWFAVKLERAKRQKEAVQAIEKLDFGGLDMRIETPVQTWLRRLLGDDFLFQEVFMASLSGTETNDALLEHLKWLTDLELLELADTQITDAGLVHLKGLTSLHELYLCDTQITDAGLEHLEGLSNLKGLDLGGTQITDAGLAHLKGLTNLEVLVLSDTQVTPEGVKKLQEALPECEVVY